MVEGSSGEEWEVDGQRRIGCRLRYTIDMDRLQVVLVSAQLEWVKAISAAGQAGK
jgi:hypothetical protein